MMESTTKSAARRQRLPQSLYALLALVFLAGSGVLTFMHSTVAHADTTWSATLGANPTWNGLQCWGGDGGADAVVSLGGVSAWQTIPANNQVDYIYCKITDTSFPASHGVTVAVNYWDGPSNGSYIVQYDSTSSSYSSSESVSMTGTSLWMTHTFTLSDANFAGGENNGADFRIATENNAAVGVAVSQITVALSNVPAPPAIQQVQLGNIFLPGQTPTFNFTATVSSVGYQVYDYDNNQVASGTAPATGGKGSITVKGLPYGNYTLVVASDNSGTLSAPVMNAFGVMPAAISPSGSSPFGATIHIDQGQDSQFQGLLSKVGISNFRSPGPLPTWSQIETSQGVYDWTQADQEMGQLKAVGYSGGVIVAPWSNQPSFYQGNYQTNAATLQAWINVNVAFFKRYANYLPYMMTEVANEPDINGWTPQQYFNVLQPFYTAVKAVDPTLQVLGPTGPGEGSWAQQFIQLGGLHYLDAWDIHPYPAVPEGMDTSVTQLEQWLQQQNGGKSFPIVVSETGWKVSKDWNTPGTATSRWQQAAYYARANTLLLKAGVKHIWWYEGADEWDTYGLLDANCCWLSASAPGGYGYYTPHPAYNVAGTVSSQLADATYTTALTVTPAANPQPVQAYQFKHADGALEDVLWTTGSPVNAQLRAIHAVTVVNDMGNSLTLQPHGGYVSLTLTGDPIFVTGADGTQVQTGGFFQISAPATAAAGENVPVKLSLASDGPDQATFVINGKSYTVEQGSSQTATVPASSILGLQTVRATVSVGSKQVGQVATTFQIGQAIAITVDPHVVSTSPAQLQLNVTVRNNMASQALTLSSLQWHVGSATGTLTSSTSIAANSSHVFPISMPSSVELNSVYTALLSLQYSAGTSQNQTLSFSQTVDFAPIFHNSLGTSWTTDQLKSQPAIGLPDQTQWEGNAAAPQVSGQLWWDWDSNYLYMTAQINQADFTEPNPVDSSWQYDDVQFAVSPALPDGTATASSIYSAFNVALTPNGPQIQRFESPLPTQVLTDVSLRVTRDNTTNLTTYYLAIPWSDIAGVSPTTTNFSLTWLTNITVAGQQGRQGWFQWGSGFGTGRNPTQFIFAQLMS